MSPRRLLVIAAGWEQTPLIETARRMGCWILATNASEAGAEGFSCADATAVIDPRDLPGMLRLAQLHRVDAVVSDQCDYSLYAAAWLGEQLGLPAVSLDAAQGVTNKLEMRRRVAKDPSVLQPKFHGCMCWAQIEAAAADVGYPLIVKPVDNRGNFGVNRVDSPEELRSAWLEAVAHSHSRIVLVEEFIEGLLTTVEGVFLRRGEYRTLAASWKKMLGGRKRVAMELIYDIEHIRKELPALLAANEAATRALGLDFGATHGEFMIDSRGRPYLIETHNRGGGVHIFSRICPALSGFDTNEHLVRCALGSPPAGVEPGFMRHGSAVLSFFQFEPGRVRGWRGEEEVSRDPRVLQFRMLIKKGQDVQPIVGDAFRHASIIVHDDGHAACERTLDELRRRITVEYAP